MRAKVFIGSEEVQYDGAINVVNAIDDIRSFNVGNFNKSYTISIPRTPDNERILQNTTALYSTTQLSEQGSIFVGGVKILTGTVKVYNVSRNEVKIYISGDDIIDEIKTKKLNEISMAGTTLTNSNVVDSWTGDDRPIRFPMIHFAKKWRLANDWIANDFVPMFRVKDIIQAIFPGWVLAGTFFTTTRGRNAYVLGKESIQEPDFLDGKDHNVAINAYSDNNASYDWAIGETAQIEFITPTVQFYLSGVTPETEYIIPETGTYRFTWTPSLQNEMEGVGGFINRNGSYVISITRNGTPIITKSASGISNLSGVEVAIDTEWVHLEKDDVIECAAQISCTATNNTGVTETTTIGIDTGGEPWVTVFDYRNLYAGIGFTIDPAEYMEDMTQFAFIQAIREDYNLRLVFDRYNKTIYFYSGDDILGTNIVDITPTSDPEIEYVGQNYKRTIEFKWDADTGDRVISSILSYSKTLPLNHTVTLTNPYTQDDTDERVSKFASSFRYRPHVYIAIFGDEELVSDEPVRRSNKFKPRLLQWYGLTSGASFTFNGTPYTTYPKAETPDKAELYEEFFYKTIRRINAGKLVTLTQLVSPSELNEFITVVSNEANEGFRKIYRAEIEGQTCHLMLNKITTNGNKAECEYIIT
jgi:hypothetical protein